MRVKAHGMSRRISKLWEVPSDELALGAGREVDPGAKVVVVALASGVAVEVAPIFCPRNLKYSGV